MRAGVVGGGTMGIGIAHAFIVHGNDIWIVEPDQTRRLQIAERVGEVLQTGVQRSAITEDDARAAESRLQVVKGIDDLPLALDLVVEAIPELVDIKRAVLSEIELRRPRLLGSNTSSISISRLAASLAHPELFVGLHFFNPVWAMKLVEIIVGSATSPTTVATALEIVGQIGKEAVTVGDAPGFATSRLGIALGLEAIRMVEEGIALPGDIDRAMVLGYGHPVGPLRLTDIVGLDVRLDIARNLAEAYGDRFVPPKLLENMVVEGKLGKKVGQGFFAWLDEADQR